MESATSGSVRRRSRFCAPSPQSAGNGEYMLNQGIMIAVIFFLLVVIAATRYRHPGCGENRDQRPGYKAVGRKGEISCLGCAS
jgi:hypothetical protein